MEEPFDRHEPALRLMAGSPWQAGRLPEVSGVELIGTQLEALAVCRHLACPSVRWRSAAGPRTMRPIRDGDYYYCLFQGSATIDGMRLTARAHYTRDGWWAVEVDEIDGLFTQARTLDEIPAMVLDAAALLEERPAADFEVEVVPE